MCGSTLGEVRRTRDPFVTNDIMTGFSFGSKLRDLGVAVMTRRAEFVILGSRVIRLQGKSEKASMRHIRIFKAESSNNEDAPSVQISI